MAVLFGTEPDITLRQLIPLIVRRKVIPEGVTLYLHMKLAIKKKENLVHLNNVELASAITFVLAKLSVNNEVKMKFQKDRVAITVKVIEKLKERCPLNFGIVRNAVSLSPGEVIHNTDRLIQKLYDASVLYSVVVDNAK